MLAGTGRFRGGRACGCGAVPGRACLREPGARADCAHVSSRPSDGSRCHAEPRHRAGSDSRSRRVAAPGCRGRHVPHLGVLGDGVAAHAQPPRDLRPRHAVGVHRAYIIPHVQGHGHLLHPSRAGSPKSPPGKTIRRGPRPRSSGAARPSCSDCSILSEHQQRLPRRRSMRAAVRRGLSGGRRCLGWRRQERGRERSWKRRAPVAESRSRVFAEKLPRFGGSPTATPGRAGACSRQIAVIWLSMGGFWRLGGQKLRVSHALPGNQR